MPESTIVAPAREYVSLSQLAEDILGLSRARVYELIERGALPQPLYDMRTRRPIFDASLQRQCLAVRRTGIGIDGAAVIFYRRGDAVRQAAVSVPNGRARGRSEARPPAARYGDLIASLQALGVANANAGTVAAAVAECFPNGTAGQQESEVLRVVFRALRRSNGA